MALGHVVQSYVNEATISFTADRDVMPDPEFYSQCLQESFEEMAALAGLDLSPPKPQAQPKAKPARKKAAASSKTRTTTKRKPRASTAKKSSTSKAKAKAS